MMVKLVAFQKAHDLLHKLCYILGGLGGDAVGELSQTKKELPSVFLVNNNSFITVDGTSILNIIFDGKEASTLYSLDDLGTNWHP